MKHATLSKLHGSGIFLGFCLTALGTWIGPAALAWTGISVGVLILAWKARRERRFLSRLDRALVVARRQATGDLSERMAISAGGDEIDDLLRAQEKVANHVSGILAEVLSAEVAIMSTVRSFSDQFDSIREAVSESKVRSLSVAASAQQSSGAVNSISNAAETTSGSLLAVAGAMEEMGASIGEVGRICGTEDSLVLQVRDAAVQGKSSMAELEGTATKIEGILAAIREISSRTNLLALNATIEAARAGEAGRGFAVVAGEVKDLAKQTAESTLVIQKLVESVRTQVHGTGTTIGAISESVEQVHSLSMEIVHAMSEQKNASDEISVSTAEASRAGHEVSRRVTEIAVGSSEIASHIGEVDRLIGGVSDRIDAARASLTSIMDTSARLRTLLAEFKTGRREIRMTPALETGVSEMDAQHRRLFELIDALDLSIAEGRVRTAVEEIIPELATYAVRHFADEERLMERQHAPRLDAHKAIHRAFEAKVSETIESLRSGKGVVASSLVNFLQDWLVEHIGGTDQKAYRKR